jgi:hypothetical protein
MTIITSAVPDSRHELGALASSFAYLRCLIANVFHKLVERRARSVGQVASDYDQGEWLGALREARWERCNDLADYVFTTDSQPIEAIVGGRLTSLPRRDYYRYRTQMLVATLRRYASEMDSLVEVGRDVTRRVCERFGIGSVQTAHIDLLDSTLVVWEPVRQGARP